MSYDWGPTPQGFRRPTYTELLDALECKAREYFGNKASLVVRSTLGIFLRIFAWIGNIIFSVTEDVYNSLFVDTAAGNALYNLGRSIGLSLLPAQKAAGYLQVKGKTGATVPAGFLVAKRDGTQYVIMAEEIIGGEGIALVPIRAVVAGPDGNAEAGTICEIVNPPGDDSIVEITNPSIVDGGQEREDDERFRDRYYKSVDFAGGVNTDGIRGELLQKVEGIYSAIVYENDTDFEDSKGLPPHSAEAVCYGGLDEDIAKAIFRRKAAGIQTYGTIIVPVLSASEQLIDIHFSRPEPVPIWIKISGLITDSTFSEAGDEEIRQALIGHIGGDIRGGLPIGHAVYFYRIPEVINAVVGVVDYKLSISSDGVVYAQGNILVGIRQKAVTEGAKVVIER